MLRQKAIEHFDNLLEDEKLRSLSVEVLDRGLEKSRLIFGGRRLTPFLQPFFITQEEWDSVRKACNHVFNALQKVKDAAIGSTNILEELGIRGKELELVKIEPGYSHVSPTARLDSFLSEESYSFVELNGESPAGIAYADSASRIFQELPVMKKFQERYSAVPFSGSPFMAEVLLSCWKEFLGTSPAKKPNIAIVDLEGLPTQQEFELFREYFSSLGMNTIITSPERLEYDGKNLKDGGFKIDIVYKRLLVNEYLPILDKAPALYEAYKNHSVCMVNSFRGKLVHKKAIFAILTDESYGSLFSATEIKAIRQHVPWTRHLRDRKTTFNGADIELLDWVRENKENLVLKPNDDYGGHGIYIGWSLNETDWEDSITKALNAGDYLVQYRVQTSRERFPMILEDGTLEWQSQLVDLDPLLFTGSAEAAFTRLSSSELANVTAGGGMVPVF
ncbi:MAG TPA: hypothetical protein VNK26_00950, partial [Pyrinomonadaceae bacterium]|nr:hypothetical protein [Pyrinomonadaceae bacterium]